MRIVIASTLLTPVIIHLELVLSDFCSSSSVVSLGLADRSTRHVRLQFGCEDLSGWARRGLVMIDDAWGFVEMWQFVSDFLELGCRPSLPGAEFLFQCHRAGHLRHTCRSLRVSKYTKVNICSCDLNNR